MRRSTCEAGFSLGNLLATRGEPAAAEKVWWRDVITPFLLDSARAAQLGPLGRSWMARTLLGLADLRAARGELEEAKQAWNLILSTGLPGAQTARDSLAGLDASAPKP
jgi:lipopolysaccharide biosynthesis regulator YciM